MNELRLNPQPYARRQPVGPRKGARNLWVPQTPAGRRELRDAALDAIAASPDLFAEVAATVCVVGAVRGDAGVLTEEDLARVPLLELEPVRRPGAHKDMKNFIGLHVASVGGTRYHVWTESLHETAHLRELEYEQYDELVTQALQFRWTLGPGLYLHHYPDVIIRRSGETTLIDVTMRNRVASDPHLRTVLDLTAATCIRLGWAFEVGYEIPKRRVANLSYLEGFRDVPSTATTAPAPERELPPRTVAGLSAREGGGHVGLARAWNRVWHREFFIDLDAPIRDYTALHPRPLGSVRQAWGAP